MKEYTLYFTIYDKKLKSKIKANSEDEARQILASKLIVLKVEEKKVSTLDSALKDFEDLIINWK